MDARHHADGLAPLWLAAAALASVQPVARGIPTDCPENLMRCFETAYESRDVEDYGRLFTTDFRYYFADPDLARKYPCGWTREEEIASARHLFEGFRDAAGVYRPPATSIELSLTPRVEGEDPDRLDSAAWYRRVLVPAVRLEIHTDDGNFLVENARHVFFLVRGDAARLDGDQPADAGHWYIRRWVEMSSAEAAEVAAGGTGQTAEAGGTAGIPAAQPGIALGLPGRPVIQELRPNPSQGTLSLAFVLPAPCEAHVAVVNVAGRIVYRRALGALEPGVHRVALALGRELGRGVYWMRLVTGDRGDAKRIVLIP